MTALSDAQLWTVVTGAGWTGQDALTAFGIALAESGGNPSATHKNNNGSTDFGLFQINSVHSSLLKGVDWSSPTVNAALAKSLYDGRGHKFTDWVTYNNRAYARFLGRAQAAAATGGATVPASGGGADNSSGSKDPVASGIASATSGNTWLRLGMFLAGALLVLIVTVSIIKNTSIGKAATKFAKSAAEAAVVA